MHFLLISLILSQECGWNSGVFWFEACFQVSDYNYRAEIKKLIPHLKCLDEIPASQTALPFPSKMNKDWLLVKESIKDGNFVEETYGLCILNYFARHIFVSSNILWKFHLSSTLEQPCLGWWWWGVGGGRGRGQSRLFCSSLPEAWAQQWVLVPPFLYPNGMGRNSSPGWEGAAGPRELVSRLSLCSLPGSTVCFYTDLGRSKGHL